jgi:hypothetical protein
MRTDSLASPFTNSQIITLHLQGYQGVCEGQNVILKSDVVSNNHPRNFGTHVKTDELQVGYMPSYKLSSYQINTHKVKVKKGKAVPVLNLAPHHEGVLGEWRYSSTNSLTLALDGGEWSASRLGRCTPRETDPGTNWLGDWVGPRAVLDAVVKGNIPSPAGNRTLEPRSSSP